MRAILVEASGATPSIVELPSRPLRDGEVRVHVEAVARCWRDDVALRGVAGPVVPGHEVAGTVTEVGATVEDVFTGERVLVAAADPCRSCATCRRGQPALCLHPPHTSPTTDAGPRRHLGIGGFAEEVVVDAGRVMSLLDGLSSAHAATLGCTVLHGAGTVRNAARLVPGERVAVIGSDPASLAAIRTASIIGARAVVAVVDGDFDPQVATALGATHVLDGASGANATTGHGVADGVRAATEGLGADAVVAIGRDASSLAQLWRATRPGGLLVVTDIHGGPAALPLDAEHAEGRTLVSAPAGLTDHDRDLTWLVPLAAQGRLELELVVEERQDGLDGLLAALGQPATGRQLVHSFV